MDVLPECVCVCSRTAQLPGACRGQKRGVRYPGNGVILVSYGFPCGCWDFKLCPLEEQLVLLTSEPALQLLQYNCFQLKGFLSPCAEYRLK